VMFPAGQYRLVVVTNVNLSFEIMVNPPGILYSNVENVFLPREIVIPAIILHKLRTFLC